MFDLKQSKNRTTFTWVAAILALLILAAGGFAGVQYANASAENQSANAESARNAAEKIESILRDESKAPRQRIQDALKALEGKDCRNQDWKPAPVDPFAWEWSPFANPMNHGNWDPFQDINQIQHNLDQLFKNLQSGVPGLSPKQTPAWSPKGEFEETEEAYIYRFDLPGVEKAEINLTVEDGRLVIEGKRESRVEESSQDGAVIRREIRHGHFRRDMTLPKDADLDAEIASTLEDGVLTVTIPRLEELKKKGHKVIQID